MNNNAVIQPKTDWTEDDWSVFEDTIKDLLYKKLITIKFVKKDGSDRVMRCTLQPDLLPPQEIKEDKAPRKKSTTSLAVYDVEANGWRSFNYRTIRRMEYAAQ